jgi:hypothetical protein
LPPLRSGGGELSKDEWCWGRGTARGACGSPLPPRLFTSLGPTVPFPVNGEGKNRRSPPR